MKRSKERQYLEVLVTVTDEVRDAMVDLDRAITRLEAALAQHRKLKADHDRTPQT